MKRVFTNGLVFLLALLLLACSETTSQQDLDAARAYLSRNELEAASIQLKNALQKDSGNAEARWLLGKVYFEAGDQASAEKELRRARDLGFDKEQVNPLLAQAMLALGMLEELEALQLPSAPDARAIVQAARGLAALAEGRTEDAETLIDEAVSLDPQSSFVVYALTRLQVSRGELDDAAAELTQLLTREPSDTRAWGLLGDIEQQRWNFEDAENAYNRAIELDGGQLGYRLARAQLRLRQGNTDGLAEDVEFLSARAPKHPGVNYIKGVHEFQNQKYLEAAASLLVAEEDSERYPMALLYAAATNYMLGNKDQAEIYATRFYGQNPGSIPVRRLLAKLALEREEYATVEELLRPVVDQLPDELDSLNLLANALLAQGKSSEAVALLQHVAELQPDSPVARTRLGAGLLMGGDKAAAVETLETAVNLGPGSQQADMLLVMNYFREGETEKAIQAAKDYQQRNPGEASPHNLLGGIYLRLGRQEDAKQEFLAALKIDPGEPTANHSLAQLAPVDQRLPYYEAVLAVYENHLQTLVKIAELKLAEGDEVGLLAYLQLAIESHPESAQAPIILARYQLSRGKPEEALKLITGLGETLQALPAVQRELAGIQTAQDDFSGAVITLETLLEQHPEDAQAHFLLARAYAGLQKTDKAIAELTECLELDPNHLQARVVRARFLLAAKDWEALESDLAVLNEQGPAQPDVLKLRAAAANGQGRKDEALAILQTYRELSPGTESVLLLAGQEALMGNADASIKLQESWLEEHPEDAITRTNLATQYGQAGDVDEAVAQYEKVLEQQPDSFVVLNNLAWYLREIAPDKALDYAQRSVELAPESADTLDTLAMVQLETGDATAAQGSIRRALTSQPDNLTLLYHSAEIDVQAGDLDRAKTTLIELLGGESEFPERPEAEKLLAGLLSQ